MTGIFDGLAKLANDKLKLGNKPTSMSVSLKSNGKRKFLKDIEKKKPELGSLIDQYTPFINSIYQLREEVVHRTMLPDVRITTPNWKVNSIEIDEDFVGHLSHYPNKVPEYDLISEWGSFQYYEIHCLEPYRFAKTSTRMLIQFIDKYLELLDFKEQADHFTQNFEKLNLGF
jgi:hypothetical protein